MQQQPNRQLPDVGQYLIKHGLVSADNRPTRKAWTWIAGLAGFLLIALMIWGVGKSFSGLNARLASEQSARATAEAERHAADIARQQAESDLENTTNNPPVQVYQPPAQLSITQVAVTAVAVFDGSVAFEGTVVAPTSPADVFWTNYLGVAVDLFEEYDSVERMGQIVAGSRYQLEGNYFFRQGDAFMIQVRVEGVNNNLPVWVDANMIGVSLDGYAERIKLETVATNAWAISNRRIDVGGHIGYFVYPVGSNLMTDTVPIDGPNNKMALTDGDVVEVIRWGLDPGESPHVLNGQPGYVVQVSIVEHKLDSNWNFRGYQVLVPSYLINQTLPRPEPTASPTTGAGSNTAPAPHIFNPQVPISFDGSGDQGRYDSRVAVDIQSSRSLSGICVRVTNGSWNSDWKCVATGSGQTGAYFEFPGLRQGTYRIEMNSKGTIFGGSGKTTFTVNGESHQAAKVTLYERK